LGRIILYLTGIVGIAIYWLTFAATMYWFIFYKAQKVLYLVIPNAPDQLQVLQLALFVIIGCQVTF
jgi:hypothetical protein